MSVKLRLARRGRKKKPFYHIVVADARAPRDGRFIEKIGSYNPLTVPATIELDSDRAFDWLQKGAQPTDTVRSILRFKGVLYRKHLMRGVDKGALSDEQAQKLYEEFVADKEAKVQERFARTEAEMQEFRIKVGGERKKVEVVEEEPVAEVAAESEGEEAQAPVDNVTEEVSASAEVATEEEVTTEEVVAEETPAEVKEEESNTESKEENPE